MCDHDIMGPENDKATADTSARPAERSVVRRRSSMWQLDAAFTLAELLITVGVLILVVLVFTQLLKSAATVTMQGHKRMDLDSQARQVLDRMAVDFAQMVKRSDVDYYVKSSWFASGSPPTPIGITGVRTLLQPGNDTMAFYSTVSGYYPSTGSQSQSPLSLVAYRVNGQNKLERMGKGLLWNAATPGPSPAPLVFMPIPLVSPIPVSELPNPAPSPAATPAWPEIATSSSWSDSEVMGSQVFRFEYYYLLKGQTNPTTGDNWSPIFSDTPWDTRICSCPAPPTPTVAPTPTPTGTPLPSPTPETVCCHYAPEGMQDVAAVVVVIAGIDPTSKVLVSDTQLNTLASKLIDWGSTSSPYCSPPGCPTKQQWQTTPGLLRAQWRAAIEANSVGLPPPAISGIRVYERYLYLSPPTLNTP